MLSLREAGLRHATYYTELAKRHQSERSPILIELPNLMNAFRFLSSSRGNFEKRLVDLVTVLRPVLDTNAHWSDLILMLEEAQAACARIGDDVTRARLMSVLAQMHNNTGSYRVAVEWAEKALILALQTHSFEIVADAHLRAGWAYLYLAEYAEALKHLWKSSWFARRSRDLGVQASSLHFISRVYYEKGDYLQALNYFRAQLELPEEVNMPTGWAYIWLRGAEVLLEMGKVKLAGRVLLRLLRRLRTGGSEAEINPASFLRALARTRFREGYVEEALSLLNESMQEMKYVRGEMHVRQDIAEAYIELGRFDEALKLIDEVIKYRKTAEERRQLGDALYLRGRALELQGDAQEALELYKQSLQVFEEIKCLPSVSGKVFLAIDHLDKQLGSKP